MIYTYYNAVIELVGINNVIGGNVNGPISNIEFIEGFTNLPTEEQIQAKLKDLQDEYEKQAYARSRADAYDPIPEQLDQLFHLGYDGWKAEVQKVKDQFPKP